MNINNTERLRPENWKTRGNSAFELEGIPVNKEEKIVTKKY